MSSQHAGQAHAADHANLRAQELHDGHQRPGDDGRPEGDEAERGSGDRIRCNAGRVIVSGAGNQTGSEFPKKPPRSIGECKPTVWVFGRCPFLFLFQALEIYRESKLQASAWARCKFTAENAEIKRHLPGDLVIAARHKL